MMVLRSGQATRRISARTSLRNCTVPLHRRGSWRACGLAGRTADLSDNPEGTRAGLPSADPEAPSVARAMNFPPNKKRRPAPCKIIIPTPFRLSTSSWLQRRIGEARPRGHTGAVPPDRPRRVPRVPVGAPAVPDRPPAVEAHHPEAALELPAGREPGAEIPAVHDGQPKPARGHGVLLARPVRPVGDLNARDAGTPANLFDGAGRDRVHRAVGPEQDDAVSAPRPVSESPDPVRVEVHHALKPAGSVEVNPLLGHAQVTLDDLPANRLEVHDPGTPRQVPPDPPPHVPLQTRERPGEDG